jgi:hypothetical protein
LATCPRCGGFLNQHHRCVGLWRLRLRALWHLLLGGAVGGALGWLVLLAVVGQPSWLSVTVASTIGMVVVIGLQRGEPRQSCLSSTTRRILLGLPFQGAFRGLDFVVDARGDVQLVQHITRTLREFVSQTLYAIESGDCCVNVR